MKNFIRQNLYKDLVSRLFDETNLIQVIIGPRQVGKTTIAMQILGRWKGSKLYATADQVGIPLLSWLEEQWNRARVLPEKKDSTLLIIDEVQKITNWSDLTKKLFDEDKAKKRNIRIILLGSSSLLVQRGLHESLAGRFELHRHYQWSYSECKEAFGISLQEYLYFGGYPGGLLIRKDPIRWARYIRDSLIETVLSKDILLMSPVAKPVLLRQTFSLATGFPAQVVSYQKMLGNLTETGNLTTIASYLKLLASAFLILPLERFSGSIIKQRGSSPKLIVFDNALISAMNNLAMRDVKSNQSWSGRIIENAVGAKIHIAIEKQGGELYYWRERDKEVDFVAKIGQDIYAIEVKSGKLRNIPNGLRYFLDKHPGAKGVIICKTYGINQSEMNPKINIKYVDLEGFFMDPDMIYIKD